MQKHNSSIQRKTHKNNKKNKKNNCCFYIFFYIYICYNNIKEKKQLNHRFIDKEQ